MDNVLLTPEEIGNILEKISDVTGELQAYPCTSGCTINTFPHLDKIAKAQIKKMIEWGDEDCPHENKDRLIFSPNDFGIKHNGERWVLPKKLCPDCWQELKQEVEA